MTISGKNIKQAHKVLQKMSCDKLQDIYKTLGVLLQPEDYDPESWYGGIPHPFTGKVLDKKWQVWAVIDDLMGEIKQGEPCCFVKTKHGIIIETKGSGKPCYGYPGSFGYSSHLPEQWYNAYTGELNCGNKHGPSTHYEKGKFKGYENFGLGVGLLTACSLWPENVLAALPEISVYMKLHGLTDWDYD